MDVKDHPVITVLGESRCYIVPIYQRQYAWGDNLLKQFWEDVAAKAGEALQTGKPKFQHYMGALILAPGTTAVGRTPSMQVVDGQQRLTTFQLFITALRAAADGAGFADMATTLQGYLFNVPKAGEKDKEAKFKLSPTPADRDLFRFLLTETWDSVKAKYSQHFYKKGTLIWGQAPKPMRAVSLFRHLIDRYVRYGITDADEDEQAGQVPDDVEVQQQRLHALQEA